MTYGGRVVFDIDIHCYEVCYMSRDLSAKTSHISPNRFLVYGDFKAYLFATISIKIFSK